MSTDDRCFCGAEWVDEREECTAGHGFGEADKYRLRAEKAEALAADLQTLLDHDRKATQAALTEMVETKAQLAQSRANEEREYYEALTLRARVAVLEGEIRAVLGSQDRREPIDFDALRARLEKSK